jgi:ketosteroid isomerase-like protein
MSKENVEAARMSWEALAEAGRTLDKAQWGRLEMERLWDPDVEYIEDPGWPGAGVYRDREAVIERFDEYLDLIGAQGIHLSVEEIIETGDQVVSVILATSLSSRSGMAWEHRWGYVGRMRDGRWLQLRAYYTPAEALEAAGISE